LEGPDKRLDLLGLGLDWAGQILDDFGWDSSRCGGLRVKRLMLDGAVLRLPGGLG
jgi:hypothetical protein